MATATHYAIEGATGDWSNLVVTRPTPTHKPSRSRPQKPPWLRQRAQYDDTHPWEALDIISPCWAMNQKPSRSFEQLRLAICTSYRAIWR